MEEVEHSAAPPPSPPITQDTTGKLLYGCEHYRRRCKIRAPCCGQIATTKPPQLSDPKDRHEIVWHETKQVICSLCNTEQLLRSALPVVPIWVNISAISANSTMMIRAKDGFIAIVAEFAGSCYQQHPHDNHSCIDNSMKNYCPVCYEYLFDSVKSAKVMKCGHTMHMDCFHEMAKQLQFRCPICSKTVLNMSVVWNLLDLEIQAIEMPEEYRYEVSILCNDCNSTCKVRFQVAGLKCSHCNSYNTRRIVTPDYL